VSDERGGREGEQKGEYVTHRMEDMRRFVFKQRKWINSPEKTMEGKNVFGRRKAQRGKRAGSDTVAKFREHDARTAGRV